MFIRVRAKIRVYRRVNKRAFWLGYNSNGTVSLQCANTENFLRCHEDGELIFDSVCRNRPSAMFEFVATNDKNHSVLIRSCDDGFLVAKNDRVHVRQFEEPTNFFFEPAF